MPKIKPHTDIFTPEQTALLPLVRHFRASHYLVGGTALALQLGHRRSVDFDLFTDKPLQKTRIFSALKKYTTLDRVLVENSQEITLFAGGVKMTWYSFRYPVQPTLTWEFARVPSAEIIGAMKLFAIAQRAKWKDYVDVYTLLHQYSLDHLITLAESLFGTEFNPKLARVQLSYFTDINYSEHVDWMPGWEVSDEQIKQFLTEMSVK